MRVGSSNLFRKAVAAFCCTAMAAVLPADVTAQIVFGTVEHANADGGTSSTAATADSPPTPLPPLMMIPDSDEDGLSDYEELNYSGQDQSLRYRSLDPFDRDTDDDGLSDFDEVQTHPQFYSWASERSLPKGPAVLAQEYWGNRFDLDPFLPDTDADGIPDGTEVGVQAPLPEGGSVMGVDGEVKPIKGTDTTARYLFEFRLSEVPGYSGPEPKTHIVQERFCFRADADPGHGPGRYFTHPAFSDSNHNGYMDGLEDYNLNAGNDILLHTDSNHYNASTNYNGAYNTNSVFERDGQCGLHSVGWDSDHYEELHAGGGFTLSTAKPGADGLPSSGATAEFYYIPGPTIEGDLRIEVSDSYVTAAPAFIKSPKHGERYLIRFTNTRRESSMTTLRVVKVAPTNVPTERDNQP